MPHLKEFHDLWLYHREMANRYGKHKNWYRKRAKALRYLIRFLKPHKRKTKKVWPEYGGYTKTYTHYAISTTVPEEWKDGVAVVILPLPVKSGKSVDLKELRRRWASKEYLNWLSENEPGIYYTITHHLKEGIADAERIIQAYEQELARYDLVEMTMPKTLLAKISKYGETIEEALQNLIKIAERT